jgi:DNA-binding NarL/FixJ family response regulator
MQQGSWASMGAIAASGAIYGVDAVAYEEILEGTASLVPVSSNERAGRARRSKRRREASSSPAAHSASSVRTGGSKLRVLVCSADPFTRRAFGAGASAPDIEVIARANLTEAVETLAAELEPDAVVLDVQVPAATALNTIQQLHGQAPDARILACDAPASTDFGLLCLLAGAAGYMSKEADLDALPRILRALAAGEVVTPRALATELAHRFVASSRSTPSSPGRTLSGPEARVLDLMRTGRELDQIATELGIRPATAQRHLGSARRKLSALPSEQEESDPTLIPHTQESEVR